jgi:hypothetical protein
MKPGETLLECLNNKEIDGMAPEKLHSGDTLKIPKISFDLEHHFEELCGNDIFVNKDANKKEESTGLYVGDAVQFIKFDLNEEGAKLRSEAAVMCFRCCTADFDREEPRMFVFDGPFLICLSQTQDSQPYFVAWIENTEVLKKRK